MGGSSLRMMLVTALGGFMTVPLGHCRMPGVLAAGRAVHERQDQEHRDDSCGAAAGA